MIDLRALHAEYERLEPNAHQFCQELARQLTKLLGTEGIAAAVPIQARVKEWPSIQRKLDHLELDVASVAEIQDLVGLRIILLFQRDVPRTCQLLDERFEVIKREDVGERLRPDQFGYASTHYVVALSETWTNLPSFGSATHLRCEVQVRTLAQHLWAAVSHRLQYKSEESVPATLRRSIHRASALLELVDLEFERVLNERGNYAEVIDELPEEEGINVVMLQLLLSDSFPDVHFSEHDAWLRLLTECLHFGVDNRRDLAALVDEGREIAQALEPALRQTVADGAVALDREGAVLTYTDLARFLLMRRFPDQYRRLTLRGAALRLVDVDHDGKQELLVEFPTGAHASAAKIFKWRDGEWSSYADLGSDTPSGFEVGDFDADGLVEFRALQTDWEAGEPYVSAPRDRVWYRWEDGSFREVRRDRHFEKVEVEPQ